jgi:hypothetical protein
LAKWIVPLSRAPVVYVYVTVPLPPAARVSGLGLYTVEFQLAVTGPPLTNAAAGVVLGAATIDVWVVVDRLVTLMTSRKLPPASNAVIGTPLVFVI